jgi:hypothetical protein
VKVFDCFPFCDELDILECRLRELDSTPVYRHVIVEAPLTHRGPAKPLVFPEHKERFAPWLDRIIYVVADNLAEDTSWPARIAAQRDYVREGLHDADRNDVIILSDIDEILSPQGVEVAMRGEAVCFEQRMALFCVDWEAPHLWNGPSAMPARSVGDVHDMRHAGRHVREGTGWHLTWLGGPEAVRAKTGRYGHSEQDSMISDGLEDGRFLLRGDTWEGQCLPRVVDDTWPKWVHERGCPPQWFRQYWQRG